MSDVAEEYLRSVRNRSRAGFQAFVAMIMEANSVGLNPDHNGNFRDAGFKAPVGTQVSDLQAPKVGKIWLGELIFNARNDLAFRLYFGDISDCVGYPRNRLVLGGGGSKTGQRGNREQTGDMGRSMKVIAAYCRNEGAAVRLAEDFAVPPKGGIRGG